MLKKKMKKIQIKKINFFIDFVYIIYNIFMKSQKNKIKK